MKEKTTETECFSVSEVKLLHTCRKQQPVSKKASSAIMVYALMMAYSASSCLPFQLWLRGTSQDRAGISDLFIPWVRVDRNG